jgi:hypothetical protein
MFIPSETPQPRIFSGNVLETVRPGERQGFLGSLRAEHLNKTMSLMAATSPRSDTGAALSSKLGVALLGRYDRRRKG